MKQAEVGPLPPDRRYILHRKGGGNSMTNKSITTESVQLSKSKQNTDPIASIRHSIVLKIDGLLRCGKPEEEIVGAAKDLDVDLIVLSTHNYQWFSHLIHGSDAEGVLRHAPCPILVVRKEEHDFIDAN